MMSTFEAALSASSPLTRAGKGCVGPDLTLELAGGINLVLKAEDYAKGDINSEECEPSFSSMDLPESFAGVFILGEPLLKRYYTVFDWKDESPKVGFGLAAAVVEGGEEEAAAAAAEAAEDVEEGKMIFQASGQDLGMFLLLQALLVRVMVVLCMVFFGTHIVSARSFLNFLESMLAYRGLLLEISEFATAVPPSEAPDADECVICLGSCEDDPQILHGVPGLQPACAEGGGCCSLKCKGCPRWRRLRCGHHFHETCIFEWLRKSRQCPVCRRHLNGTSDSDPSHR